MFVKQVIFGEESSKIGFNPLTLAIALVVITIIIAALLSFWVSGIRSNDKKTDCSTARFKLYSGIYDSSTSSISLILENFGSIELKQLKLYLFYQDKKIIEKPLKNLDSNKIKSYNIIEIPKDFEKGLIKSNCPEITIQFIEMNRTLIQV